MQKKRSFVLLKFFNWTKWYRHNRTWFSEINDDKTLTGNECDDEQSLQKFFEANAALLIRMLFAHITRESDVSTGTEGPEIFKVIFEIVKPKAWVMTKKRH